MLTSSTTGWTSVRQDLQRIYSEHCAPRGASVATFSVATGSLHGTPSVAVRGDLDRASVAAVQREAEGQIAGELSPLVLDLSETTFIDSAAMHLIADLDERLAARGGRLVLVVAPGPVERAFGLVEPPERVEVVAHGFTD